MVDRKCKLKWQKRRNRHMHCEMGEGYERTVCVYFGVGMRRRRCEIEEEEMR